MNTIRFPAILATVLIAMIGVQNALRALTNGAHVIVTNKHLVTTHSGLIGPSHYEERGTITNDGTETSPKIALRMIVRDQYGTKVFSITYIPTPNVLASNTSTTFGIHFTSDDVRLIDTNGLPAKLQFSIQVLYYEEAGVPQ